MAIIVDGDRLSEVRQGLERADRWLKESALDRFAHLALANLIDAVKDLAEAVREGD